MKFEIKNRFSGDLIFSVEADSWKVAIELAIKANANLSYTDLRHANLSYADLRYANLSYADLRHANLSYADLRYANLSYANLSYANLSYADLSSADLSYAKTEKRYIQIACIGSRKGMTTYCFEDDIVLCGCFKGILSDFEIEVKKTHKENKQYLAEYLGFIEYVKSLKGESK